MSAYGALYSRKVSEDSQTYSAREIVLELFPATPERLVPAPDEYRLEPAPHGEIAIVGRDGMPLVQLTPVAAAGKESTQLCCDACERSAPRAYLQLFRAEVPGSHGRRYRYVSLCRDTLGCELRRLGDSNLRELLERLTG